MPPDVPLHFGPYTLAGPQGPLWRAAEVVPLPPKALAVLWWLASQAGQVVTKAALLETVWADTAVGEGVLTGCLHTLRQVLGEDAKQPRYLATVHRVGYRFVAPVTTIERSWTEAAAQTPPVALATEAPGALLSAHRSPGLVVAREVELAQLQQ